jgi:nicotinamide-nucleotide amidase
MGIGESSIDNLLGDLMRSANPTIGTAAHLGQCDVRIAARGATEEEVETLLDQIEAEVRRQIGKYIYSLTPDESYETVVSRRLQEQRAAVALVESNTGGAIARRLRSALADFDPVMASYILSADDLPSALADLTANGAELVSQACAEDAALRALAASGATLAVAELGTSGAEEGVYGRQSGETWLALAANGRVRSVRIPFGGVEEFTVTRIGNQALMLIDRALANED